MLVSTSINSQEASRYVKAILCGFAIYASAQAMMTIVRLIKKQRRGKRVVAQVPHYPDSHWLLGDLPNVSNSLISLSPCHLV